MKISVTLNDIHAGVSGDCKLCPIALAIEREVGCKVDVCGGDSIEFFGKNYCGVTDLDEDKIDTFIGDFDGGTTVHPFDFELREVIDVARPTKDELLEYYGFEDSTK